MITWVNLLHLYQPPYQSDELIDKIVNESYVPLLETLSKNPQARVTINICGSLIERLEETRNSRVLMLLKRLVQRRQIELTGSAFYHPILPLLPRTEAIRQIKLNTEILRRVFGETVPLRGFFLPEMAYHKKVGRIIKRLGFEWIMLDEISLTGALDKVHFNTRYAIKDVGLAVVFRSRERSKSFVPLTVMTEANKKQHDVTVITATDGEMYGHHHKHGEISLERALQDGKIQTKTVSEFIDGLDGPKTLCQPIASSWESRPQTLKKGVPYQLWDDPKNKVHRQLWELKKLSSEVLRRNEDAPNFSWAQYHLDRGSASCTWWWASEVKPDAFSSFTWNPSEIEKGARDLISSVRSLPTISPHTYLKAEKIYQALLRTVWTRHWKKHRPNKQEEPAKSMQPEQRLFDREFMRRLFVKKLRALKYRRTKVRRIDIHSHKKILGYYHIINRYNLHIHNVKKPLDVFCNAHYSVSREGAYRAMEFIWRQAFHAGKLRTARPFFYYLKLNAMFYFAMPGSMNLYNAMTDAGTAKKFMKKQVMLTADWLKKLHAIPADAAANFNPRFDNVKTAFSQEKIILRIRRHGLKRYEKQILSLFQKISRLDAVNNKTVRKTIIHGDFHPQNIILEPYGQHSLGVIDFTDTCLGDPLRDLGNFLQQFEWMSRGHLGVKDVKRFQETFIRRYFGRSPITPDQERRLYLYQAWTAFRSAVYFLTIQDFDTRVAETLIQETRAYLAKHHKVT